MTATALLCPAITGCSIHPLPQDYTGVPTADIVRQVRCEARAEISDNIGQWLRKDGMTTEEQKLGIMFTDDPTRPVRLLETDFPVGDRDLVTAYKDSGIAYDFTFDMTETNDLDTSFDFLGILRHTTGSAALTGGFDRTRENIRTFTVTDTFDGLLNMKNADGPRGYCHKYISMKNATYPITGKIGLGDLFHTFFDLSLYSNLDGVSHKGPPAIGETLTFTTALSGSLTPKIVLGQAARGAQLADASLKASTSRTDVHKLVIATALPAPPPERQLTIGPFVIAATAAGSEAVAAEKVSQIIFRFEIGKSVAAALTAQ